MELFKLITEPALVRSDVDSDKEGELSHAKFAVDVFTGNGGGMGSSISMSLS